MVKIDSLQDCCSRFICRAVKDCVTEDAITRGAQILKDRQKFRFVKQKLLAKIIDETRLEVNDGFPLNFFDTSATLLTMRGASKLSDSFLSSISTYIDNIRVLDLSNCSSITNVGVGLAIETNPNIVDINLGNCRRIDDDVVEYLILASHLEKISIAGDFNFSTEGIVSLCTDHPNRKKFVSLDISGIDYEKEVIDTIQKNCSNITSLSIGYNDHPWMTASYFTSILLHFDLKALHVHWCKNLVDDSFLEFLSFNLPSLEELDVCGVKSINAEGIVRLIEGRYARSIVNTSNDSMVNDDPASVSNNKIGGERDNDSGNVNSNNVTEVDGGDENGLSMKSSKPLIPLKVMKIIFIGGNKASLEAVYKKYEPRIRFIKK